MSVSRGREQGLLDTQSAAVQSLPPGKARDICIHLQNAIFQHRLLPGAKLSEDEVGDIFGAGRTVVRTALQALAHSERVTIERNRGAFVARPDKREANEVFEARALIEPRVARMAAERCRNADARKLRSHIKLEHEALAAEDLGTARSLSGQFHIAIADIADHLVLSRMVRSLISRSSLIIALYWKRRETNCESHSHMALVDALASHDKDAAEEIMQSHMVDLHSGLDLKSQEAQQIPLAQALFSKR